MRVSAKAIWEKTGPFSSNAAWVGLRDGAVVTIIHVVWLRAGSDESSYAEL
jgi:hypothetical protein